MATKAEQAYQVAVERQKAAQAAGTYDLNDLPGGLASPAAAIRIGKTPKQDKVLKGNGKSISAVAKVQPGAALAVFGRPESRCAASTPWPTATPDGRTRPVPPQAAPWRRPRSTCRCP